MKKLLSVLTISFFIALFYPTKSNAQTKTATDGEFTYKYVENDPLNARVYTLKNGLKVYLSVNKDNPVFMAQSRPAQAAKTTLGNTTALPTTLSTCFLKAQTR